MKRKGFTLVELLIVIVVISILGAMMMISSSEAVSSAQASTIVSNLNAVKAAALSYYADHLNKSGGITQEDLSRANLMPYLKKTNDEKDTEDADTSLNGYKMVVTANGDWYALCSLAEVTGSNNNENLERKAIIRKLADKARSAGITFSNNAEGKDRKITIKATDKYDYIYMWVR